jgi:hypothetical protein
MVIEAQLTPPGSVLRNKVITEFIGLFFFPMFNGRSQRTNVNGQDFLASTRAYARRRSIVSLGFGFSGHTQLLLSLQGDLLEEARLSQVNVNATDCISAFS